MVTPVMISQIKWGTYLFFAVVNACFIPIIYMFYPETKRRSLEEIDLIFAKGYLEKISYVKASFDMPFLSDREVEAMAREYGFADSDEEQKAGQNFNEKTVDEAGSGADTGTETRANSGDKTREDTRRGSERTLHMGDTQERGFKND